MEPRMIVPAAVRPGDTIELSVRVVVGELRAGGGGFFDTMGGYWGFRNFALKLLDRPERPREVGSRWRDPETGAEYIKTDETDDTERHKKHYLRYRGSGVNVLCQNCDIDLIARLVPLDGDR